MPDQNSKHKARQRQDINGEKRKGLYNKLIGSTQLAEAKVCIFTGVPWIFDALSRG
jgi:hypothetical protein